MKIEHSYDDRTLALLNDIDKKIAERQKEFLDELDTTMSVQSMQVLAKRYQSDPILHYLNSLRVNVLNTAIPKVILTAETVEERLELVKKYEEYMKGVSLQ